MKYNFKHALFLTFVVAIAGCKKPYLPPVVNSPNSYLVVEGVINAGSDSTFIRLSKTVNLSSKVAVNPVLNATLDVESDQNSTYPLTETSNGNYAAPGLNLDNSRKYRLRITTSDGREYVSDFVSVVNSPPIDSVNFAVQGNGINIFASTHDPKNNTHYYRWDYQETWIFHSEFDSFFKSNGTNIVDRDLTNDEIYTCWKSDSSSTINIGSSAKLTKDVIVNSPVAFVSATVGKLNLKYSILVRQYALTGEAYAFWQNLKKNTEQLGSIFDAQPSEISGNIHSVANPSEPVIGYISVGSTTNFRLFVNAATQLPSTWRYTDLYSGCSIDSLYFVSPHAPIGLVSALNVHDGNYFPLIPISGIYTPTVVLIGYTAGLAECVDCTQKGTNKQPSFWK